MASSIGKMFQLGDSIMTGGIHGSTGASGRAAKNLGLSSSLITCYQIKSKRDTAYWRFQLQALQAVIENPDIVEPVREGLFMSALFSASDNPGSVMDSIAKENGIRIKIVTLKIEENVVMAHSGDKIGEAIIKAVEFDADGSYKDTFEHSRALDVYDNCTEKALVTVVSHIVLLAGKAVTAANSCVESASKRLQAMQESMPVDDNWFLQRDAADMFAQFIRAGIIQRRVIVVLVIGSDAAGSNASNMASCVAHAGTYLKMAGLTGFQMVCQFVISAQSPLVAFAPYRSQVAYFCTLMERYKALGADAPYLKFLGNPDASKFSPGNFDTLYQYATGYASCAMKTMADYIVGSGVTGTPAYKLGASYAAKAMSTVNDELVQDLKLDQAAVAEFQKLHRSLVEEEMGQGATDDIGGGDKFF